MSRKTKLIADLRAKTGMTHADAKRVVEARVTEQPPTEPEVDPEVYVSRGKGFQRIVRDMQDWLLRIAETDADGNRVLTNDDFLDILDGVDDDEHASEPLAVALFELIFYRAADVKIVFKPRA